MTESVGRFGEGDKLLVNVDRNPNKTGARLIGICQADIGIKIRPIAETIRAGKIKTLIVFGEDVTKHGIDAEVLGKLDTLIVSDILPSATTKLAHYVLPGSAHAEKRGSFTNVKGRVQKFMKAVEAPVTRAPNGNFYTTSSYNVTGQNGFVND